MSERIKLSDTMFDVLTKMSEGNPGALSVLMQMQEDVPSIDPDLVCGGLGCMMFLDTLGLYGPSIWILYKDICGSDLTRTVGLLRGWQLGIVSDAEILMEVSSIQNGGSRKGIDVDAIVKQAREQLAGPGQSQSIQSVSLT